VVLFEQGRRRWLWRWLPADEWLSGRQLGMDRVPMMGPDAVEILRPGREGQAKSVATDRPEIVLVFTDGKGARWVRWPDGRLKWRAFWGPPHWPFG
jgi:hypothetical protein